MRGIDDGVNIAVFDARRDLRRGVRVNGCTKVASVSLRHERQQPALRQVDSE